jgi:hypothetical protein
VTTGVAAPDTVRRMTVFLALLLFLAAAPVRTSFDQIKAEPNPERRARAAVEFAGAAEKKAEASLSNGDMKEVVADLKTMQESMEMTRDSLIASRGRRGAIRSYTSMPNAVPANC